MQLITLVRAACAALLAFCLSACASDPNVQANQLARQGGLQREEMRAGAFVLTTFGRITRPDQPLTVYLEGDGFAYRTRLQASDDPTPRNAQALAMAATDRSANVVYLARPCQFTPMAANPGCAQQYWTSKRYSEEIVSSVNAALSQALKKTPGQRVNLVGFSGGGALAVLVAARRQDVASIRTVAGNLDVVLFNRAHGTAQMPESLNPIDFAAQVAYIPQMHFSGVADAVVPAAIGRGFVAAVGPCAQHCILNGMAHDSDWAAVWPQLLAVALPCTR